MTDTFNGYGAGLDGPVKSMQGATSAWESKSADGQVFLRLIPVAWKESRVDDAGNWHFDGLVLVPEDKLDEYNAKQAEKERMTDPWTPPAEIKVVKASGKGDEFADISFRPAGNDPSIVVDPAVTCTKVEASLHIKHTFSNGTVLEDDLPFDPDHGPHLSEQRMIARFPSLNPEKPDLIRVLVPTRNSVMCFHGFAKPVTPNLLQHQDAVEYLPVRMEMLKLDGWKNEGKVKRVIVQYEDADGTAREEVIPATSLQLTKYVTPIRDRLSGQTFLEDEFTFVIQGSTSK